MNPVHPGAELSRREEPWHVARLARHALQKRRQHRTPLALLVRIAARTQPRIKLLIGHRNARAAQQPHGLLRSPTALLEHRTPERLTGLQPSYLIHLLTF